MAARSRRQNTKEERSLLDACRYNDVLLVKQLYNQHKDARDDNFLGFSPLHHAAWSGHLEIVSFLLEQGAEVETKDGRGETPLHIAAWGDHLMIVSFLLEQSAEIEAKDDLGRTPLHRAAREGHHPVVQYLSDRGSCINAKSNGNYTPLHLAVINSHLEIVTILVEHGADMNIADNDGTTPLHFAARYGYTDVVKCLLTEGHCDPNRKTKNEQTPLALTNNTTIIRLLLQNGATTTDLYKGSLILPVGSPSQPAQSTTAVFMVGDKGAGKSTLTKALKTEKEGVSRFFAQWSKVGRVKSRTAGMECHQIHSDRVGSLSIFDLAGHREYHSSHDTVIRNAVTGHSSGIFVFVVDLTEAKDELQRTIHYWLSFMKNQVSRSPSTPTPKSTAHLIVVGSHADAVKPKSELQEKQSIIRTLCQSVREPQFVDFSTVDCRHSESPALDKVRAHILQSHNTLQCTSRMTFQVHCVHVYIISKCGEKPGLQLGELLEIIRRDIQSSEETYMKFLPQDISSLREVCSDLNRRGIMLFVEKKDVENSWIIIDRDVLLHEINGTLFAPKGFVEHKELTCTGVIPCSKLCEVFKNIIESKKVEPELLFNFMLHMEFCQEITEKDILKLVVDKHPQYKKERHFLFPALTSPVPPDDLWTPHPDITYSTHTSGWVLQCCGPQDYLSPRFLQVLLLRLTFTHALPVDAHESDPANPALQQVCTIWRNGIYWTTTSCVDVLVEISDHKVTLLLRCKTNKEMKLVRIRAKVIADILKVKEEFCPSTETVELFVPNPQYPVSTELAVSSSKLAHSLSFDEESVVVKSHTTIDIIDLLYFEPYLYLNKQCLVDLYCTSNIIDAEFIDNAAGCMCVTNFCKVLDHFCTVLNVPPHKVTADSRSSDYHKAESMFRIWMTQSEGTFECLRKEMDKYSVFSGRNTFDVAYTPPTPATSAEHDTSKEQEERDDSC